MPVRANQGMLRTPERLDARFGVVAGLYVAALLSPVLVGVAVRRLQLGSEVLALGLLGAVGAGLTALVAGQVTPRGGLASWFNSTWPALLVPALGVVPMVAYLFDVILFLGLLLTDLQAETAASLVGFVGFFLGIAASVLGSALVLMARARMVDATVDDGDVEIEWTARWDQRARLTLVLRTLVVLGSAFGLAVWQLGSSMASRLLPLGMVLVFGVRNVVSGQTYRVTPAGLVQHRGGRPIGARKLVPWSQFEGLSVTEDAVVLHRPLPHLDVRCRRWDVATDADESAVVAALETHLDRRDS